MKWKNIGWSPEGTEHPKNSENLDNWYGPGTGSIDILNHLELARETDGQIHEPMTKKLLYFYQWEKTMLIIMMQLSQMLPTPLYNSMARRLYIMRKKINNLSSST